MKSSELNANHHLADRVVHVSSTLEVTGINWATGIDCGHKDGLGGI